MKEEEKKSIDKELKNLIYKYLMLYDTNKLKIEIDVNREMSSFKISVLELRSL